MAHVGDAEAGVGIGLLVVFIACQGSVERLDEADSVTKNSKREKGGGKRTSGSCMSRSRSTGHGKALYCSKSKVKWASSGGTGL